MASKNQTMRKRIFNSIPLRPLIATLGLFAFLSSAIGEFQEVKFPYKTGAPAGERGSYVVRDGVPSWLPDAWENGHAALLTAVSDDENGTLVFEIRGSTYYVQLSKFDKEDQWGGDDSFLGDNVFKGVGHPPYWDSLTLAQNKAYRDEVIKQAWRCMGTPYVNPLTEVAFDLWINSGGRMPGATYISNGVPDIPIRFRCDGLVEWSYEAAQAILTKSQVEPWQADPDWGVYKGTYYGITLAKHNGGKLTQSTPRGLWNPAKNETYVQTSVTAVDFPNMKGSVGQPGHVNQPVVNQLVVNGSYSVSWTAPFDVSGIFKYAYGWFQVGSEPAFKDFTTSLSVTGTLPTSPGNYRFVVKAMDRQGHWSTSAGRFESAPVQIQTASNPTTVQLIGLSISGPATVFQNGTAQFTAKAFFSDGSTQTVTPTWSENSSATSISSSGLLSAGSVSSDTVVTVSASYTSGNVTKSANADIRIPSASSSGGSQTVDVIVNGNFESGKSPWGPSGYADVATLSYPHGGSWYAYLGNTTVAGGGSIAQFVPIPASATAATLSFYVNVASDETTTTSKFDTMKVDFSTGSDQYIGTVASFSNLDKAANGSYVLKSYNVMSMLSAYKGQSVFLVFSATTDNGRSTIFRIDDVKLQITTPNPVTLTGLSISGASSMAEGQLEAYNAKATFSDGTTQTVSPNSWSEDSSITTISGNGYLTAGQVNSDSSVNITASYTYNGLTKQATKSVTVVDMNPPATLVAIAINGPGLIDENSTAQYTATATFSNGSTQTISPSWSENSSVTTVSSGGLLSASEVANDTTVTLSASYTVGGVTKNANIGVIVQNTVPARSLVSLDISGASELNENSGSQYVAMASYSDGSSEIVSPTWSENSSVTTISSYGKLSAGEVAANIGVLVSASYQEGGKTVSASKTITVLDLPSTSTPTPTPTITPPPTPTPTTTPTATPSPTPTPTPNPTSGTITIEFNGLFDSYDQQGTLNHDGSIGAYVPASFSVQFDTPTMADLSIFEGEDYRSTVIPARFIFQWGNYSLIENGEFSVIQFLADDQVRFDFGVDMNTSNFSGTLLDGMLPIAELTRFPYGNDIEMNVWFHDQGATLENVWSKFLQGRMNLVRPSVNWEIDPDFNTNTIYASAYAGSLNAQAGTALLDSRVSLSIVPKPSPTPRQFTPTPDPSAPTPTATPRPVVLPSKPRGFRTGKVSLAGGKLQFGMQFTGKKKGVRVFSVRVRSQSPNGSWSPWKVVKQLSPHSASAYTASLRLKKAQAYQVQILAIGPAEKVESRIITVRVPKKFFSVRSLEGDGPESLRRVAREFPLSGPLRRQIAIGR